MIDFIFTYRKKDYTVKFPSKWDELTTPEMEAVANAMLQDNLEPAENKANLLLAILNLRAQAQQVKLPANWMFKLDPEEVAILGLDQVNFLFNSNDRTINPYPVLNLPGIRGSRRDFVGPADDFNDITCAELEDCEHHLNQFTTNPLKSMAALAAIFWRLPVYSDEFLTRQEQFPYQPIKAEYYAQYFEYLPPRVLMACMTFIIGCRNKLPKYFPGPYGKPTKGEGPEDPAAFTKCIHAGAGAKNGTRENIRKMLAKEFLFDLQMEFENAKRQEEEFKKAIKKK